MLKVLVKNPTQSMMGLVLLIGLLLAGFYFTSLFQESVNPSYAYDSAQQTDSTGSLGLQDQHHQVSTR
jgi:hypothetical protein